MGRLVVLLLLGLAVYARADEGHTGSELPEIVVPGRGDDLLGVAKSATEGTVGAKELQTRPVARPAEVVETVPGMIITQHAGGGKANQYYLRGFNLDHGTDFAFYVDDVPINMVTHAHGQGYTDLNWLIPELVKGIDYQKGPYYANQGDFGNVGSASIKYFDSLPYNYVLGEGGQYGYGRALGVVSQPLGAGNLLTALEYQHYEGPWTVPNGLNKYNGQIKYSVGTDKSGYSVGGQAYYSKWRGTDQIPQRAIDSGLIGRFGALDDSPGGDTHRASAYGEWHRQDEASATKVNAYYVHYGLDLFSDFSYFTDPVNTDEFEQYDNRSIVGARAYHTIYDKLLGHDTEYTFGLQARNDFITAKLDKANHRVKYAHVSTADISELNVAPYVQNKTRWLDFFRTEAGVRADSFLMDVRTDTPGSTGHVFTGAFSPKLSLVFGPWSKTEYYLQGGFGLRTNDARGVLARFNPNGTPLASPPSAPIVKSRGAEIGVRTGAVPGLNSTLSLWTLKNDSDTFFSADEGTLVDAGRPSLRTGVEWTNFYSPLPWLTLDADFGYSSAFYTDDKPGAGIWVEQAVRAVASGALTIRNIPGFEKFFTSLRFRYFGPRPLTDDNSQQSASVGVFNFLAGYDFNKTWTLSAEILNLLDSRYNDAEYYDVSRLQGEPAAVSDHMVHAGDPFSARVSLVARF